MKSKNRVTYRVISYSILLFCMLVLLGGCGFQQGSQSTSQNPETHEETDAFFEEGLALHFLDIGHGDATLITCGSQAMLVDCGKAASGRSVAAYLAEQGIAHLDYLILSHPDSDHIGGATFILERFSVGQVLASAFVKDSTESYLLEKKLTEAKLTKKVPEPGQQYTLGEAVFTFLGPVDSFEQSNNMSLVFRLDYGKKRFLFTGDQEKKAEKALLSYWEEKNQLGELDADLLKVGHHGRNDASGKAFLAAVTPAYAVISCGPDAGDAEPEEKALERLENAGSTIKRTDLQGTIVVTCDGEQIF